MLALLLSKWRPLKVSIAILHIIKKLLTLHIYKSALLTIITPSPRPSGNHHIVLAEIKSTHDSGTPIGGLEVTSDSRVIKNNKRSAQHQLRDHLEILRAAVGDDAAVQSYIMWPFLGAATRDPRGRAARRWAEDGSLHVFEDTLGSPGKFEGWFGRVVLGGGAVEVERFEALLNR